MPRTAVETGYVEYLMPASEMQKHYRFWTSLHSPQSPRTSAASQN
jgi:hypothetical protein